MPEKLVAAHQAGRLQFLGAHASGRRLKRSRRGTRPHRAMAIPLWTRVCSWQIVFMLRTAIIGAVCAALLSPSASSSVSEKLSRQDGNVATGQLVFNNACRTCHTTKEGDNRLGPHLYKIVGRKAGSLPNYGYSSAMKSADFVWDEAKLNRFIANPDEIVPGNNMKPYGGLASAEDRAKILAFLRSLTTGE
jgi:cytochrome c